MKSEKHIRYKQWMINKYLHDDSPAGIFTRQYVNEALFPSVLTRPRMETYLRGMELDDFDWCVFYSTFEDYKKRPL
jgi:hypothetical protein